MPPSADKPEGSARRSRTRDGATPPARNGTASKLGAKLAETAEKTAATAQQAADTARVGVDDAQRKAAAETLPREVAVARGARLSAVAIAGGVGFAVIFALVRLHWSGAFDVAVTRALQRVRVPGFATLMRLVSWPGFPPQSRAMAPIASGALALLGFRLEALFQVLAYGTGPISTITKAFMRRPRPTEPDVRVVIAPLGGSSFPSGHVITYMGVYGFMAYLAHTLVRPVAIRRALVGFFGGLVALVGPSRIYQGHHWPTDVIASYLLGLSYLIGVTSLYRKLKGTLAPEVAEPAGAVESGERRKT